MPATIKMGKSRLVKRRYPLLCQEPFQGCPVQRIQVCPRLLPVAHSLYRRLIARPPIINQAFDIKARDLLSPDICYQAATPINHRSEYVEKKRLHLRKWLTHANKYDMSLFRMKYAASLELLYGFDDLNQLLLNGFIYVFGDAFASLVACSLYYFDILVKEAYAGHGFAGKGRYGLYVVAAA